MRGSTLYYVLVGAAAGVVILALLKGLGVTV